MSQNSGEPQSAGLMDHALSAAVPMWLIELKPKGEEYWLSRKGICAQTVAEKGDVLMYGSKKVGAAAEVFNRLAEGIALLCLITRGPVPFGKRVYYFDRPSELFETEAEANERVWTSVPTVQEADQGTPQSEAVRAMREDAKEATEAHADRGSAGRSKAPGGDDDAT